METTFDNGADGGTDTLENIEILRFNGNARNVTMTLEAKPTFGLEEIHLTNGTYAFNFSDSAYLADITIHGDSGDTAQHTGTAESNADGVINVSIFRGFDSVTGGVGNDTFILRNGTDEVNDFGNGTDVVRLSGFSGIADEDAETLEGLTIKYTSASGVLTFSDSDSNSAAVTTQKDSSIRTALDTLNSETPLTSERLVQFFRTDGEGLGQVEIVKTDDAIAITTELVITPDPAFGQAVIGLDTGTDAFNFATGFSDPENVPSGIFVDLANNEYGDVENLDTAYTFTGYHVITGTTGNDIFIIDTNNTSETFNFTGNGGADKLRFTGTGDLEVTAASRLNGGITLAGIQTIEFHGNFNNTFDLEVALAGLTTINFGAGNDTLEFTNVGHFANITAITAAGDGDDADTVKYSGDTGAVSYNLNDGEINGTAVAGISNFEIFEGSGENDTFINGANANTYHGFGGIDTFGLGYGDMAADFGNGADIINLIGFDSSITAGNISNLMISYNTGNRTITFTDTINSNMTATAVVDASNSTLHMVLGEGDVKAYFTTGDGAGQLQINGTPAGGPVFGDDVDGTDAFDFGTYFISTGPASGIYLNVAGEQYGNYNSSAFPSMRESHPGGQAAGERPGMISVLNRPNPGNTGFSNFTGTGQDDLFIIDDSITSGYSFDAGDGVRDILRYTGAEKVIFDLSNDAAQTVKIGTNEAIGGFSNFEQVRGSTGDNTGVDISDIFRIKEGQTVYNFGDNDKIQLLGSFTGDVSAFGFTRLSTGEGVNYLLINDANFNTAIIYATPGSTVQSWIDISAAQARANFIGDPRTSDDDFITVGIPDVPFTLPDATAVDFSSTSAALEHSHISFEAAGTTAGIAAGGNGVFVNLDTPFDTPPELNAAGADSGNYGRLTTSPTTNPIRFTATGGQVDNHVQVITGTNGRDYIGGWDSVGQQSGGRVIRGLGGNDKLRGGDIDEIIYGGNGVDDINGGDGADIIIGGAGADRLEGGNGIDIFEAGGGDRIIGFIPTVGEVIYLTGGAFDSATFAPGETNSLSFAIAEGRRSFLRNVTVSAGGTDGVEEVSVTFQLSSGASRSLTDAIGTGLDNMGTALSNYYQNTYYIVTNEAGEEIDRYRQLAIGAIPDNVLTDFRDNRNPAPASVFGDDAEGTGAFDFTSYEGNRGPSGGIYLNVANETYGDYDGSAQSNPTRGTAGRLDRPGTITIQSGDDGYSTFTGTGESDLFIANSNVSGITFNGGGGADIFMVDASITSDYTFNGGEGDDILRYTGAVDTISTAEIIAYTLNSVEVIEFTGTGGDADNALTWNQVLSGVTTIDLGTGNDTFSFADEAHLAALTIMADGGGDTVIYTGASTITFDLSTGIFAQFENATGSSEADTFTGDAGDNIFTGGGGADTFNLGNGDSVMDFGNGADIINLIGFIGISSTDITNLEITYDAEGDTITFTDGTNTVTVDVSDATLQMELEAADDLKAYFRDLGARFQINSVTIDSEAVLRPPVATDISPGVLAVLPEATAVDFSVAAETLDDAHISFERAGSEFADDDNGVWISFTDDTYGRSDGAAQVANTGGAVAKNVQVVTGTAGRDIITGWNTDGGTSGGRVIRGLGGNDTLTAGAGLLSHIIFGGSGDDTITGGTSADILVGGEGADTLDGGGGADIFEIGNGDNIMTALAHNSGAVIYLSGGAFDSATIGSLRFTFAADGGNTSVTVSAGTPGVDEVSAQYILDAATTAAFGAAAGATDEERLKAYYANDGAGAGLLNTGAIPDGIIHSKFGGREALLLGASPVAVDADFSAATETLDDAHISFENTGITGNGPGVWINFGALNAGRGKYGMNSASNTLVNGTGGNVDLAIQAVTGTNGSDYILGWNADGGAPGIRIINGLGGNDEIRGGNLPHIILGGAGGDTIRGGNSRDILIGGAGADTITGGGDIIEVGPGDTISGSFAHNTGGTIYLSGGVFDGKNIGNFNFNAGTPDRGGRINVNIYAESDSDNSIMSYRLNNISGDHYEAFVADYIAENGSDDLIDFETGFEGLLEQYYTTDRADGGGAGYLNIGAIPDSVIIDFLSSPFFGDDIRSTSADDAFDFETYFTVFEPADGIYLDVANEQYGNYNGSIQSNPDGDAAGERPGNIMVQNRPNSGDVGFSGFTGTTDDDLFIIDETITDGYSFDGGDGEDILDYTGADGAMFDLSDPTAQTVKIGEGSTISGFSNFEIVSGGSGADTFRIIDDQVVRNFGTGDKLQLSGFSGELNELVFTPGFNRPDILFIRDASFNNVSISIEAGSTAEAAISGSTTNGKDEFINGGLVSIVSTESGEPGDEPGFGILENDVYYRIAEDGNFILDENHKENYILTSDNQLTFYDLADADDKPTTQEQFKTAVLGDKVGISFNSGEWVLSFNGDSQDPNDDSSFTISDGDSGADFTNTAGADNIINTEDEFNAFIAELGMLIDFA